MKLKVKLVHKDAVAPKKAHENDAGFDLTAVERWEDDKGNIVYNTGISVQIPKGYVGLLFPRSSIANKTLDLANSVGVIDADYTGEIGAKFKPTPYFHKYLAENAIDAFENYEVGDRIVQLVILELPTVDLEIVGELDQTVRGEKGWGSTNSY